MSKVLEFIDVNKKIGHRSVLNSVNLTANRGEIFCMLGRDNLGISAALELASGIGWTDSGKILLHGTDTEIFPIEARKNTGLVLPKSMMDRNLSIRTNLINRAGFYYSTRKEIEDKVDELIEVFKLETVINSPYGKTSDSVRQKANFARAFMGEPSILISNNATDGLSMTDRGLIWRYIVKKIKYDGLSVIMSTNIRQDTEFADKLCVLEDGKVIYEDYVRNAKKKYSHDRLILYADKTAYKTRLLTEENYNYTYYNGAYYVNMRTHTEAIKFVSKYFDDFKSYEIKHTTLADAYLSIIDEFDKSRGRV